MFFTGANLRCVEQNSTDAGKTFKESEVSENGLIRHSVQNRQLAPVCSWNKEHCMPPRDRSLGKI